MATLQSLADHLPRHSTRRVIGMRGEYGTRWWSCRDLHDNIDRAAAALAHRGVERGQTIVLWARNCPEWAAFFLAAMQRGIIVAPADAGEPADRVAEIVRRTGAVLLLAGPDQESRSIPIARLSLADLSDVPLAGPGATRVAVDANAPAVILFTSGSTGEPRGVVLTHGNLVAQISRFTRVRRPARVLRMRILALSPLSHVQGLILGLCIPLSVGLTVVYAASLVPAHVIQTIHDERVRFLSTVPRMLDLLEHELRPVVSRRLAALQFVAMARTMGRRFRFIFVGGATLPVAREMFWRRSGVFVVQGYGLTETSALATINVPLFGKAGSIGRPVHPDSVRLSDEGEILVRGPHVSSTFVGEMPGDAVTSDGYLRTGDIAVRDRWNRLYFAGRARDVIVTAEGHNVHPAAIEARLKACAGVRDAVVVATPRDGLEELHAILLLDTGADAAAIVQQTNRGLAPYERLRSWSVWPERELPRGVLQKVRRDELAQWVTATRTGPRATALDDQRPMTVAECLAEPNPRIRVERLVEVLSATPPGVNVFDLLDDAGLDSIERMQIAARLGLRQDVVGAVPPRDPRDLYDPPAPAWPFVPGAAAVRVLTRAIFDRVVARRFDVHVEHADRLAAIAAPACTVPALFVLSPDDPGTQQNFVTVYRVLPRRLRRTLMFFMGSFPTFTAYVNPPAGVSWRARAFSAFAFHLLMPAMMPFVLVPALTTPRTTSEMRRACSRITRGFNAVATWGRGVAIIAAETQAVVVPARLRTSRPSGAAIPVVTVTWGQPVWPRPQLTPDELHAIVEHHLLATVKP